MCKTKLVVPLGLLLAMTLNSALGQVDLECVTCPADANSTGISAGISVQRLSDGSFVNPGESVLPCETLLVNSDAGFKSAIQPQIFAGFVGVTAEMLVNGVSAGSVAPDNMTTTRIGPAGCAATLDLSMNQFTYVIQPGDAGNSILFTMDFAGKASLGGTCALNVLASPEIEVNVISCDDGDACTTDTCDVVLGCINTPIDCDDNDECTTEECVDGECVYEDVVCNDNDPCTTDTCNPATGCVYTADVVCNDGDPCTTDVCVPNVGCEYTPDVVCNDNDPCTTDACVPNVGCVYTSDVVCNDNDPCTTDACVPNVGCVYTADVVCNDNDPCTTDACVPNVGCVYTADVVCNDNDPCTTDACVPNVGCVYTPIVCNDNDTCTDDSCVDGVCVYTDNGTCGQNGCTPGFWKNCTGQWCSTYSTSQLVSSVFTVPTCIGTPDLGAKTLHQALSLQGGSTLNGGAQILLRAGTAGVLNACKGIGYPLTAGQVISQVNEALASCDRATIIALAGILDYNNNLGCRDAEGNGLPCKPKN